MTTSINFFFCPTVSLTFRTNYICVSHSGYLKKKFYLILRMFNAIFTRLRLRASGFRQTAKYVHTFKILYNIFILP
jgi:hypothetical protein